MTHRALVSWYVVTLIMTAFVLIVRGPVRDAAWEQPCRDLRAGKAIPGIWDSTEPCRKSDQRFRANY